MSLLIVGESDAELTAVLDRLHELGVQDVTRVAGRPVAIVGTNQDGPPTSISAAEVASRLGISKPAPRPARLTRQRRRYQARKAQKRKGDR